MVFDVTQLNRVVYLYGGYPEYKLHRGDKESVSFDAGGDTRVVTPPTKTINTNSFTPEPYDFSAYKFFSSGTEKDLIDLDKIHPDEYDEYTLYLFPTYPNSEDTTQSGRNQYLSAYYGGRRLTDILVVDSLPDSRNYPDGILYAQMSERDGKKYVSKLHYKYKESYRNSDIVTYKGHGVRSFTLDQTLGVLHLDFFDDSCDVPILSSEGRLSSTVLNNLIKDAEDFTQSHIVTSSEATWSTF